MKLQLFLIFSTIYKTVLADYPELPELWKATTIDPPMKQGIEEYKFVSVPTEDNPSAMWSKYDGCSRLIYLPHAYGTRYLLGCDAIDCCSEDQEGNQVEFQIPNVHYADPNRKVKVSHQKVNVTNFGKELEVDEWSWSAGPQKFYARTLDCEKCYKNIQLIQWESSVLGTDVVIQFKDYEGIDPNSEEGKQFVSTFTVPEVCQDASPCPEGLHKKYFH
jgi:hypothetical protein